jgi:GTP-binding protein
VNHAIVEARFAAGARSMGELPPPLQNELAFAGRSNVGKSSLLNALMNRRNLARTSSTPGCTRAINFFEVRTREDSWLTLVDLPGYGYANRSKTERRSWGELIEGYLLERPVLRSVAILVDVRRGLEFEEQELLKMLADAAPGRDALRTLIVATKLDRLPKGQRASAVAKLGVDARKVVGFSTAIPETTDAVWRRLVG